MGKVWRVLCAAGLCPVFAGTLPRAATNGPRGGAARDADEQRSAGTVAGRRGRPRASEPVYG